VCGDRVLDQSFISCLGSGDLFSVIDTLAGIAPDLDNGYALETSARRALKSWPLWSSRALQCLALPVVVCSERLFIPGRLVIVRRNRTQLMRLKYAVYRARQLTPISCGSYWGIAASGQNLVYRTILGVD